MSQSIITPLPALITKPSEAISLAFGDVCATCGGDIIADQDTPLIAFCATCYAVDLAPVTATLAALAWAKTAGHRVDDFSMSEWTHEDDHDRPPVTIPGRYWYIILGIVQDVRSVSTPLYVVQQSDGSMQVVPDDFPTCRDQWLPKCDRYIVTDSDGMRHCPEHGSVTAWGIPISFYADEPDLLAEDTAAYAQYGTVQWFDDYEDKVDDADDE